MPNALTQFPEDTATAPRYSLNNVALSDLGRSCFRTMPSSHRAQPGAVSAVQRKLVVSHQLSGGTQSLTNDLEHSRYLSLMLGIVSTCDETSRLRLDFKVTPPQPDAATEPNSSVPSNVDARSGVFKSRLSRASFPSGKVSGAHMATITEQRRMKVTPADLTVQS